MKRFYLYSMFMSILFCSNIFAVSTPTIYRGINYDPTHSELYAEGFATGNVQLMRVSIDNDLQQISSQLGIHTIKTFYASYSSSDGKATVNITQEAAKFGMHVMLGVFEFTPGSGCDTTAKCEAWTKIQVSDAINAVSTYPATVIGICVGNEDASNRVVANRIIHDISVLRAGIHEALPMGIGTAQTDGTVKQFINNYHSDATSKNFIDALDFLGINVYPFWSNFKWGDAAKKLFEQTFAQNAAGLKSDNPNVILVETEEGWPSGKADNASLSAQRAYYSWWKSRQGTDRFSSFYFSTYDKLSTNNADGYFGVYNFAGENKDSINNGITIVVKNIMRDRAILLACTGAEKSTPTCWPLSGVTANSRIPPGLLTDVKLDKSIPDYLLAIVDNGTSYPAACIISKDKFVNGDDFSLTWSPDGKGDQACGLSTAEGR